MIRLLLLGAAALAASAFAAPRVREATAAILAEEMPGFPWQSVGLVLLRKDRATRVYRTGFFYGPDRFLVAHGPSRTEDDDLLCENETYVYTGKLLVTPDFDLEKEKPTYQCDGIQHASDHRGFSVLKLIPLGEKPPPAPPIPLLDEEMITAGRIAPEDLPLTLVGYEFGNKGAQLSLADRCHLLTPDSPFSEGDLDSKPYLKEVRYDWASLDCAYRPGWQGAPLVTRLRGRWHAFGMAAIEAAVGSGGAKVEGAIVLFPIIPRLTKLFGKSLLPGD